MNIETSELSTRHSALSTQINFYHLTASPLERALPKLLEKAYSSGWRVVIAAESDERVEKLNELLWTYDQDSFLPHGSAKDGYDESQPILIATDTAPANGAKLLVITDGRPAPEGYERVLDMFDGNDEAATSAARTRWKGYKDAGAELSYFQQTAAGGWEKKA